MGNNHFQTFHDNPYPPGLGWPVDLRAAFRGQLLLLKEMLNSKHDIKDHPRGPCQLVLLGISHPYHPRLNLNKPLPNSPTLRRACMGLLEAGNPTAHRPTSSIPTVHRDLGRLLRRLRRPRQNLTAVCSINSHHSLNKVPRGVPRGLPRDPRPEEVVCNSSSKW